MDLQAIRNAFGKLIMLSRQRWIANLLWPALKTRICIKEKGAIIFCGPATPWGKLHQRPQNFAKELARLGNSVVYCIQPFNVREPLDGAVLGPKEESGVILFSAAEKWANQIDGPVSKIYTCYPWHLSEAKNLKRRFPGALHVHDVFDDPGLFCRNDRQRLALDELVSMADKLLYSASELKPKGLRGTFVPNGCDMANFSFEKDQVRLMYVGAIDTWFDFEMLAELASCNPCCEFTIIGRVAKAVQSDMDLLLAGRTNLKYVGPVPYDQLKYFASAHDYGLIPFKINAITNATSPIKMYEYLAAGLNVISTPLPEVKNFEDVVFICKDYSEANEVINKKLKKCAQDTQRVLRHSTWNQRVLDAF